MGYNIVAIYIIYVQWHMAMIKNVIEFTKVYIDICIIVGNEFIVPYCPKLRVR